MRWFTAAADKAALGTLIMDATHAFVADQQQSAEAYSWFRNNRDEVGALLDANAAHPGRSPRNHLLWLADANAIPCHRVDEVPAAVGLTEVAHRRAGAFSLEDAFIRRTAAAVAVLFAVQLILCAYAAVTLVLAALVLVRRDA